MSERVRDLRKSVIYRAMLRNRSVEAVLTLDPYFASYASRTYEAGGKVAPIADPAHPPAPVTARKAALAGRLPRDRVVLNQMARILFLKKHYADAGHSQRRQLEAALGRTSKNAISKAPLHVYAALSP